MISKRYKNNIKIAFIQAQTALPACYEEEDQAENLEKKSHERPRLSERGRYKEVCCGVTNKYEAFLQEVTDQNLSEEKMTEGIEKG
ncbi:hypothetical protein scyTo_0019112 [Scyliorhinus torazame]|uniref:Uncharacterized protein n=1 Tax=Scyliorhinus torazame TaxID=75743 RepID=A0A401PT03_SCYTO|nr:hypothetical protein [Scyliorhinus torazame]